LNYIVGKDGKKSILIAGHTPAERDLLQKRVQAALSNLEQYQGAWQQCQKAVWHKSHSAILARDSIRRATRAARGCRPPSTAIRRDAAEAP